MAITAAGAPDPQSVVNADLKEITTSLAQQVARFAGKKVLITGAAGMLPAYLADTFAYLNQHELVAEPIEIILLVRRAPGSGDRLSHLAGRPNVTFLVQDACAPIPVASRLDFIIHAASPASPKAYRADPIGTLEVNSSALKQLLDVASTRGCDSFLYFSSSEVYGTPDAADIPTPEAYIGRTDFRNGRSCYVEAKRFGEALCAAYYEQHAVPVKVVRPFHIHGPGGRLDDGRIVAEMISRGVDRQRFELLSDGRATRTYGYISDATIGFLLALLSDSNGDVFNIGSDEPETSILELATTISRLFGRTESVQVASSDLPDHLRGAPNRVCPDLTKARTMLGYRPQVTLEDGLRRTVAWHLAKRGLALT